MQERLFILQMVDFYLKINEIDVNKYVYKMFNYLFFEIIIFTVSINSMHT